MTSSILNFNIGVLGHVDSGKTSLSKCLSTVASTACFDKNPQSRERGITLDLGFSSFQLPFPESLKAQAASETYSTLQLTLVDCPGHASLMKTIIGGAAIVDLVLLVVDISKGIQTQTAECLVLAEILCSKMIVILNKIDLIPKEKRDAAVTKMTKRISKTLESTRFSGCPVVAVAANPGGEESQPDDVGKTGVTNTNVTLGFDELISTLSSMAFVPERSSQGTFVFAVDHCFALKGKGVILTGTCLQGSLAVGESLEIPALKEVRKVKSLQMFKTPVEKIAQGDRAGICVTQFDTKKLERGVACSPGSMPLTFGAIVVGVVRVSHFRLALKTGAKLHVSIGHETQIAKLSFFGDRRDDDDAAVAAKEASDFDWNKEYVFLDELELQASAASATDSSATSPPSFSANRPNRFFALVEFERPICVLNDSLVVGSKLDADIHQNFCRVAFKGRARHLLQNKDYIFEDLHRLKVFKAKVKEGVVERIVDQYSVIAKGLFRKESKISAFEGLRVHLSPGGEAGIIEGSFGQSGKFKVRVPSGLDEDTKAILGEGKKKGKKETGGGLDVHEPVKVILQFKKYVYGDKKKIVQ